MFSVFSMCILLFTSLNNCSTSVIENSIIPELCLFLNPIAMLSFFGFMKSSLIIISLTIVLWSTLSSPPSFTSFSLTLINFTPIVLF